MQLTDFPSLDPVVWCLVDPRAGNKSQCLGVANALKIPFTKIEIQYGPLAALPNVLLGGSFLGLTHESTLLFKKSWPNILIAAGRRTAPIARSIKKRSGGKTKIIQIMDPGIIRKHFDMVVIPIHDKPSLMRNQVQVIAAPHCITKEQLQCSADKWRKTFSELPRPWVGLFIGGSTRRRKFTHVMATELGSMISNAVQANGGAVLGTTSPRSGDFTSSIIDSLTVPNKIYHFSKDADNPYLGILSLADYVVVTGESVSMCSEACAAEKPVYLYTPTALITEKHKLLHEALIRKGYARRFFGKLENWSHPQLNTANQIAQEIRKRFF
ncbi:MAG: hypothetical protein CFH06_01790 [Alphaproteobacteria bacterium MarineAlpha3_Bin5]|nr:nucleoside-diphosphate sugar epimerase [Magnetovibrio sp.]PPR76192.1 MAG: hypothetical protein CFH06_01790 [Alphaproteobacteria bacterium MarineAlpha3_Bin5]